MTRTLQPKWWRTAIFAFLPCLLSPMLFAAEGARTFAAPDQAADALIDAAARFDVTALEQIFGPGEQSIFLSNERPLDRERAVEFAAKAHEKHTVDADPNDPKR